MDECVGKKQDKEEENRRSRKGRNTDNKPAGDSETAALPGCTTQRVTPDRHFVRLMSGYSACGKRDFPIRKVNRLICSRLFNLLAHEVVPGRSVGGRSGFRNGTLHEPTTPSTAARVNHHSQKNVSRYRRLCFAIQPLFRDTDIETEVKCRHQRVDSFASRARAVVDRIPHGDARELDGSARADGSLRP